MDVHFSFLLVPVDTLSAGVTAPSQHRTHFRLACRRRPRGRRAEDRPSCAAKKVLAPHGSLSRRQGHNRLCVPRSRAPRRRRRGGSARRGRPRRARERRQRVWVHDNPPWRARGRLRRITNQWQCTFLRPADKSTTSVTSNSLIISAPSRSGYCADTAARGQSKIDAAW